MRKERKPAVFLMLSIMTAGTIILLVRPPAGHGIEGTEKGIKKAVRAMDTAGFLKDGPAARVREFYQLMQWEANTRRTLKKDTLTGRDSIFLKKVNQQLNRLLYEKD